MPPCVVLAPLAILAILTVCRVPSETALGDDPADKSKLRRDLVVDIRGANQYCFAYIALLGVMATITANRMDSLGPLLKGLSLWPFGVALVAASLPTLFVPAGYGDGSFTILRFLWLRSILCEQSAVVFTFYGIWKLFDLLLHHAASG